MRGRALMLALLMLPDAAFCDALAFQIWPNHNADNVVNCRIELKAGQIIAVEFVGGGMPPRLSLRWPVRRPEEQAVLHALQAFASGELPAVDAYSLRMPEPPYVVVTWSTRVNDTYMSGFYLQTDLNLPPVLTGLIDTVLPGGPCEKAITAPAAVPG